jgi:hypothetical protein
MLADRRDNAAPEDASPPAEALTQADSDPAPTPSPDLPPQPVPGPVSDPRR